MTTPVIINGAFGKMGSLACEAIRQHPNFTLVATLGRNDNLSQIIRDTQAKIVIELTNSQVVYANSLQIIQENVHPVIGASGLTAAQIEDLQSRCKQQSLGGMIVPNFSIGIALMQQCAALIAKKLGTIM